MELYSFLEPKEGRKGASWDSEITFHYNKKRMASKGATVSQTLRLSFEDSVFGCIKRVCYKAWTQCTVCGGKGHCTASKLLRMTQRPYQMEEEQQINGEEMWMRGGDSHLCRTCGGTGTYSRRSAVLTINSTCFACEGRGVVEAQRRCPAACTNGRLYLDRELQIEVPPGVLSNTPIVYPGEGSLECMLSFTPYLCSML